MKPKKTLLAILTDSHLFPIDDCIHRITYRVYEDEDGFEIVYRHSVSYCAPWATKEERKPRIEKLTVRASAALAEQLRMFKEMAVPLFPQGGNIAPDAGYLSMKLFAPLTTATFVWSFASAPNGYGGLDRTAKMIIDEIQKEMDHEEV